MQRKSIDSKVKWKLAQYIEEQINKGVNKQELFEKLREEYSDEDILAKMIAVVPNLEFYKKYRVFNWMLVAALSVIVLINVFGDLVSGLFSKPSVITMNFPIIEIIVAALFLKCRAYAYRIVGILGIIVLLSHFRIDLLGLKQLLILGLWLIITILAFYTGKKLFPNYGFIRPKKDAQGKYLF